MKLCCLEQGGRAMTTISERLGTLDTEALTLKEQIDNTWDSCMSAAEPLLTILSGKCQYLRDQLNNINARKAALEAGLTDPGVHELLLAQDC